MSEARYKASDDLSTLLAAATLGGYSVIQLPTGEAAFLDQEAALGWTLVTVAMSVATTDTFGECLDEVRYYFRRVIEDAPYR